MENWNWTARIGYWKIEIGCMDLQLLGLGYLSYRDKYWAWRFVDNWMWELIGFGLDLIF